MDLIEKYIGEAKVFFPKGRSAYTPGDIVKITGNVNKKYKGKQGEVVTNLMDPGHEKKYHIEIDVNGKRIVVLNTEVELVKPRSVLR
jgi:hypothetical protein